MSEQQAPQKLRLDKSGSIFGKLSGDDFRHGTKRLVQLNIINDSEKDVYSVKLGLKFLHGQSNIDFSKYVKLMVAPGVSGLNGIEPDSDTDGDYPTFLDPSTFQDAYMENPRLVQGMLPAKSSYPIWAMLEIEPSDVELEGPVYAVVRNILQADYSI